MKNNKKISNILAIFIILGIALINNIDFFNNTNSDYETGRIVRVVDGDTAVVKIKNENQKVRFIGVDTPEYNPKRNISQPWGKEASEFSKNLLKDQIVYLEKDVSETDKYNRLLRYIWLEPPQDLSNPTYEEIENLMINGILVRDGYARAKTYKPDTKYQYELKKIEKSAKNKKLAIWS
ncbi:thermonuclease family protein [Anaerococcus sp. Marseille-Q5996]|uniref:thermonuclease family protein n=1 Tax=Anaerococcus sp. Marseille-Q5996 TaxID=2972769 RepID=UPI0021C6ED06|nr:thermonuclease family protein [Anaerococcus sp. Marseille-Q5996]